MIIIFVLHLLLATHIAVAAMLHTEAAMGWWIMLALDFPLSIGYAIMNLSALVIPMSYVFICVIVPWLYFTIVGTLNWYLIILGIKYCFVKIRKNFTTQG